MAIWEPTKCCCCCGVRTGSIVIGILSLIGSITALLNGVQTLALQGTSLYEEICENSEHADAKRCEEELKELNYIIGCSCIVEACFHLLFSSLLLYGIVKKKTAMFIPLMIMYTIQISLMILASLALIIFLTYMGVPFAIVIIFAAILGSFIFLQTYCLLVIRAHYYEIKREKGQVHITLTEEVTPLPGIKADPYPASPVPPYPASQVPPYPGSQVPPYPGMQVPPYPGMQVPPYPGMQVPPYSASQVPPYSDSEVSPYPGKEVPPYHGTDVPLYPDHEKNFK